MLANRMTVSNEGEGTPEPVLDEVFYPAERVPFVEWEELSGAKPAVLLTGAVTVLAFVTGLSNLGRVPALEGPLSAVVAVPPAIVQFGGVFLAFVLGVVTFGLQRRKRLAWRGAIAVLPVLAVLPLATLRATDVPLLLLTAVTYPLLVVNRFRFDETIDLSPLQIASLSSIVAVVLYGTVGTYGLRDQFLELETWGDAVYYVLVTIATVGYGDITPVTAQARWFSLSIIVFGTGAFTVAIGALVGPVIESKMTKAFGVMTASDLTLLEDHVVVLGYGDVTESLLDELTDETEVVVVTPDQSTVSALQESEDGPHLLTGDQADESVLRDARVEAARGVVVGSNDDARDVLALLATRNVAPDVRTVAAATDGKHVEKLREVGADEVIDPRTIGGRLLGRSVLDGESPDALLGGTDSADADGRSDR